MVEAFKVATKAVSIEDFREFVLEGGYEKRELWSDEAYKCIASQQGAPATWTLTVSQLLAIPALTHLLYCKQCSTESQCNRMNFCGSCRHQLHNLAHVMTWCQVELGPVPEWQSTANNGNPWEVKTHGGVGICWPPNKGLVIQSRSITNWVECRQGRKSMFILQQRLAIGRKSNGRQSGAA